MCGQVHYLPSHLYPTVIAIRKFLHDSGRSLCNKTIPCIVLYISGCLNINNLGIVVREIWEARVAWHNIGVVLRIPPDTLEAIKSDYRDTKDCFREMLKVWLRTMPQPTWTELADALKSPMVECEHVAVRLPQN